jgi:hypothetical protein
VVLLLDSRRELGRASGGERVEQKRMRTHAGRGVSRMEGATGGPLDQLEGAEEGVRWGEEGRNERL